MSSNLGENALQRLECILRLLKETSVDDKGARAVSARGLLSQIDAEFVHLLQFFSDILGKVKKVSQQLQDQQADLGEACKLISSLREDLLDIRNSNLIGRYCDRVTQLCKKCSISPTITRSRKRNRQPSRRLDEFIVLESTGHRSTSSDSSHVHISNFYPVLDCFVSELDSGFSRESSVIYRGISALSPGGNTFLSEEPLNAFASAYSINGGYLKHEIALVRKLLLKEPEKLTSIMNLVIHLPL